MKKANLYLASLLVTLVFSVSPLSAQTPRYPAADIHLPLSADVDGPLPYMLVDPFPELSFVRPVSMGSPPGENNRLFVVERHGRVRLIPDLSNPTTIETILDLQDRVIFTRNEQGLLDIEFHPNFAENGYFYVVMTANMEWKGLQGVHNYLARFQMDPNNPNAVLPGSELPIFAIYDYHPTHNPGDLFFGPDGYLYVTCGDNAHNTDWTQRVDFWQSGILRIDVDKRPGNVPPNNTHPASENYLVPADNFLVDATEWGGFPTHEGTVTELFTVGLRNPWRNYCDPVTGVIYSGDVGASAYEELNIIESGANYGWAHREGPIAGPQQNLAGPPFTDPILSYPHGNVRPFEGSAIICGVIYRGDALPELREKLIFGDHMVGRIWSLDVTGGVASDWRMAVKTTAADNGISAFAHDPRDGEVLVCLTLSNRIKKMVRSPAAPPPDLPEKLSETGLFTDTAPLTPHPALEPYEVAIPFWSDGATKTRWMALPETGSVNPRAGEHWTVPPGCVFVKHFEVPTPNGQGLRPIETRVLMKTTDGIYGLSYEWNATYTDADLVPAEGKNVPYEFVDGPGAVAEQTTWQFPSRVTCLDCHNQASGEVLGFTALQLNREVQRDGAPKNQLTHLSDLNCFSPQLPAASTLRRLAPPDDLEATLDYRARSYLHANCANCHRPGTANRGVWDARIDIPRSENQIVNGPLFADPQPAGWRAILPGQPGQSMIFQRLLDPEIRMPPVGSSRIDQEGIDLIQEWIQSLQNRPEFAAWAASSGLPLGQQAADDDPDLDGFPNFVEYLAGTSPIVAAASGPLGFHEAGAGVRRLEVFQPAGVGVQVEFTEDVRGGWAPMDGANNHPYFYAEDTLKSIDLGEQPDPHGFFRLRFIEP